MTTTLPNPQAVARALKRCVPGPGGCQLWSGAKADSGHAKGTVGGRTVRLGRVVLATKLGRPLEAHEKARHTCDVPHCLNADHLVAGTQADNVRDMMARGRHVVGRRKLTRERAEELRRLRGRKRRRMTVAALAELAGVRKRQVERILRGEHHA